MEEEQEVGCEEAYSLIPNPLQCFTKLILFQADLIYNSLTFLFSPISCFLYILHEFCHRTEETKDTVESTIHKVPSTITHGSTLLLKMLSLDFLGAAYVCVVLMVVLVLAVVLGVGLLQLWVDQPVFVRESLYFDYTEPLPKAVFHFCNVGAERNNRRKKPMGVPIGHTFHVTLVLLMPESDFNRDIGVFQGSLRDLILPKKEKKEWENLFAHLNSFEGLWVCLSGLNHTISDKEKSGDRQGESSVPNYLKKLLLDLVR